MLRLIKKLERREDTGWCAFGLLFGVARKPCLSGGIVAVVLGWVITLGIEAEQ